MIFFWFSNCDFSFRNDGHITRPTKQITARLGHTRLPASDISLRHRIENLGPVTCEAWRISWRHTYIYIYICICRCIHLCICTCTCICICLWICILHVHLYYLRGEQVNQQYRETRKPTLSPTNNAMGTPTWRI